MIRASGTLCAGGLLLLVLAGCATDSFSFFFGGTTTGHEQVISGSVDNVSASVQGMLTQNRIAVASQREGEDVRLNCTAPDGQHFFLVFSREKAATGERTHVRLGWEKQADEQLSHLVVGVLAAHAAP